MVNHKLLGEHFGSHILRTAAVGVGYLVLLDVGLGEAEVGYFDFAGHVEKDVLKLDVSEKDVILVQVLQAL